jgi:hypothetical protein
LSKNIVHFRAVLKRAKMLPGEIERDWFKVHSGRERRLASRWGSALKTDVYFEIYWMKTPGNYAHRLRMRRIFTHSCSVLCAFARYRDTKEGVVLPIYPLFCSVQLLGVVILHMGQIPAAAHLFSLGFPR